MLDITTPDLPVHPSTGLAALAVLDSGRIVWPVLGGAPDDDDKDGQDDDTGTDDGDQDGKGEDEQDDAEDRDQGDGDDEDDRPLGPKGEKALAALKAKVKDERAKRRAAEAKLNERGKPADDTETGDGQADAEKIRKDAEGAATAKANQRILRSEVKAAAAGKLADPKDALRLLDLDQFEVGDDGEIDEDEIAEAIEDLLKRKPYLAAAAAQGGRRRFEGGADGGARKGSAKPITEEQLKAMTPAEIDKAYAAGKLAHLL